MPSIVQMCRRIASPRASFAWIALTLVLFAAPFAAWGALVTRLENGENLNVAVIGTSLSVNHNPGWSEQAAAWMNSLPYTGKATLYNESMGASASQNSSTYTYNSAGLTYQLPNALNRNPDAVFIEFGVNDCYVPYNITQQQSVNNLQKMIDVINSYAANHRKKIDIVVQTMNNCADVPPGQEGTWRSRLPQYSQAYRDIMAVNPNVLLIAHLPNWTKLFNTNPSLWWSYVPDGLHPTPAGNEAVMMPTLKATLTAQVSASPHRAVPIALKPEGYNWDAVWSGGTDTASATMGNWCWYTTDPTRNGGAGGLPTSGIITSSIGTTFQLATYGINAKNALRVTSSPLSLAFATPGRFESLSILSSMSGSGPLNYVLNFADGTTTTGTITSGEWSLNPAVGVYAGNGYAPGGGYLGYGGCMFEDYITLSSADRAKILNSVTFSNASTGVNVIWAISGYSVPEPSAIVLLAAPLIGLLAYAWRKHK